jgi:predicted AAA+ superfamily ATPase
MEFSMSDISFPVGRIQFLDMNPLAFPEYLIAIGREEAANIVLSKPKSVSDSIHRLLLDELKKYCFIGGMPESVKVYIDSKSLKESFFVHKELSESFRHDFSKYAPRIGTDYLDSVLAGTARHVGQQIIYTHLTDLCSHPTIKKAFHTLCKARLISKVSSASPAGLPLKATSLSKRFKAIMVDIGLWQHLNGIDVAKEFPKSDLLSIYQGAMAEQFVGQEILAAQNLSLYYWSRSAKGSTAEVDYLTLIDGNIVPVEVKSGPAGRLRSLHLLLKIYQNCPFGIVFSSAPFSELKKQRLKFIPLYYAYSMIKRD